MAAIGRILTSPPLTHTSTTSMIIAVAQHRMVRTYDVASGVMPVAGRRIFVYATAWPWIYTREELGRPTTAAGDAARQEEIAKWYRDYPPPVAMRARLDDLLTAPRVDTCEGHGESCALKRLSDIQPSGPIGEVWEVRTDRPDPARLFGVFLDGDLLLLSHGERRERIVDWNRQAQVLARCVSNLRLAASDLFQQRDISTYFQVRHE